MKTVATFSFEAYRKILEKYSHSNCDFASCSGRDEFSLIRHDVEFSPRRALEIARLDDSAGVESSFLFQVKSNAYNLFSSENLNILQEVKALNRKVGLHLYVSEIAEGEWASVEKELELQVSIFESVTGMPVDRFSFHRPPRWVLENRADKISGYINMYGESFFEFSENPQEIRYLADSRHEFAYGHPLGNHDFKKFQILLHPDEWTRIGYSEQKNFESLLDEHSEVFIETMNNETTNYAKYLKKVSK